MSKKMDNWPLYIAAGLGLVGVLLGLRKAVVDVGNVEQTNDSEQDVIKGLSWVIDNYGRDYAKKIEQLLRWESAHFTSQQWLNGTTAGMEAKSNTFPFGWPSLEEFVTTYGLDPNKFSVYAMIENNTGIQKTFIKFPDAYTFVIFLAWFINTKRSGRFGYWYSLDETSATRYEGKIDKVIPKYVNAIG